MENQDGIDNDALRKIIEGILLVAGRSMDIAHIQSLFEEEERPPRDRINAALEEIEVDCQDRGFELKKTASGYRFQVRQELATWINRLWDEKPKRYSRALLETLSLIAYRQPITRGDIEQIRGVSVSSDIIKTLMEREWIRVVGHRDVPGRPALFTTTRQFLDYFNLKTLDELPPLSELKDFEELESELDLDVAEADDMGKEPTAAEGEVGEGDVGDSDESIKAASQDTNQGVPLEKETGTVVDTRE